MKLFFYPCFLLFFGETHSFLPSIAMAVFDWKSPNISVKSRGGSWPVRIQGRPNAVFFRYIHVDDRQQLVRLEFDARGVMHTQWWL
jgi:hypothetical protein